MSPFFGQKPGEDKSSPSPIHCVGRKQVTGSGSSVPGGEGGDGGKACPFSCLPEADGRRCQAASLSYSPWLCLHTMGLGVSR